VTDLNLIAQVVAVAVKAALEAVQPAPLPVPPTLPAWCSCAEYARHVGKAAKTIREYARRAPPALAIKYGRDWRVAGPAFDAWVRAGGPFRQRGENDSQKGSSS
jgi:hypothetical protein